MSRKLLLFAVCVVILLSAIGLYWKRRAADEAAAAARAATVTRTAKVGAGAVERTMRLTGVTAAENFVSLVSPQMRGSRGDRSRRFSGGSSGDSTQQVQSTARSGSGGNTPSVSVGGGESSGVASTSGASSSGGGSSAFQTATSRTARSSSVSSRSSGSSTRSSGATSASLGSEGLGTTGGSFGGGGGGGGGGFSGGGGGGGMMMMGGGGEFALVLQELAKPGSMVKKGDVVAEFDRQYMLNRLDDYRDSVVQSDANIRKQLAQLEVTRDSHRQQIRAAQGAVERAALDLKTTPVRSAIDSERLRLALEEAQARHKQLLSEVRFVDISEKAQLRISEISAQETRVELKRAEANADRMISKAPIDGLVVMQQTFRGSEFAQIQQGDQVFPGQPFMQIVDLRSMVINATVNQTDVEVLRIGQRAKVRFDAYPDLELPAHIFSVGAITRQSGFRASFMKEIPVRLRLDKMDPRVIPDLSVSADVIMEREEQAEVVAPLESVFRDAADAKPYVFVRQPQGWQRREVELGLRSNVRVAVRSGLRPGELVALGRPNDLPQNGPGAAKRQN